MAEARPGPGCRLDPATPADAEAIARLAVAALPEAWSTAGYRTELGRPDARAWLARSARASRPAGVLVARRVLDELHVWTLAVGAGQRRRGVASALLRAALEAAAAEGVRRCHLEVRADNGAAQRLYARHGFQEVGRRVRRSPDAPGALLLARTLAGTPRA